MFKKIIFFAFFVFAVSAHSSDVNIEPMCGNSPGPEIIDDSIIKQICFIKIGSSDKDQGIKITLRSGQVETYRLIDFNPEDGEGVNTLTFEDSLGGEFSLRLFTDLNGKYVRLSPLANEPYPFNEMFLVSF